MGVQRSRSTGATLVLALLLVIVLGACDGLDLGLDRAAPTATPHTVPTTVPTVAPPTAQPTSTSRSSATPTPRAAGTATEGATAQPLGTPLAKDTWRTVVRAPGLPEMDAAATLGAETRLVAVGDTRGLDALRAALGQPPAAWVSRVPSETLIVGVLLGTRRGLTPEVAISAVTRDDDTIVLSLEVVGEPDADRGPLSYPLHLIAIDRAALPTPLRAVRFVGWAPSDDEARSFAHELELPAGLGLAARTVDLAGEPVGAPTFVPGSAAVGTPQRATPDGVTPDSPEAPDGAEGSNTEPEDGGEARAFAPPTATAGTPPPRATFETRAGPITLRPGPGWQTAEPPAAADDDEIRWLLRLEHGAPAATPVPGARLPADGARVDIGALTLPAGVSPERWLAQRPRDAERYSVTSNVFPISLGPTDMPAFIREGQILPYYGRWREWLVLPQRDSQSAFVVRAESYGEEEQAEMAAAFALVEHIELPAGPDL